MAHFQLHMVKYQGAEVNSGPVETAQFWPVPHGNNFSRERIAIKVLETSSSTLYNNHTSMQHAEDGRLQLSVCIAGPFAFRAKPKSSIRE